VDEVQEREERAAIFVYDAGFSREAAERLAIEGDRWDGWDTAMTAEDETIIRAWLAKIGEVDPQNIADTLALCRRDPEARAAFLRWAEERTSVTG
jgi:hypothetical protein